MSATPANPSPMPEIRDSRKQTHVDGYFLLVGHLAEVGLLLDLATLEHVFPTFQHRRSAVRHAEPARLPPRHRPASTAVQTLPTPSAHRPCPAPSESPHKAAAKVPAYSRGKTKGIPPPWEAGGANQTSSGRRDAG